MSMTSMTSSPWWTAAGWTMLHLLWVGLVIGLMAMLARRALRPVRPEVSYCVALVCLLALLISPAVIFIRVLERQPVPEIASGHAVKHDDPGSFSRLTSSENILPARPDPRALLVNPSTRDLRQPRVNALVPYLPWLWMSGSLSTLVMLATGLIGVEQLRRSSRLVEAGDLPRRVDAGRFARDRPARRYRHMRPLGDAGADRDRQAAHSSAAGCLEQLEHRAA